MAESREWLSIEELADELGIPVRTVYAWRAKGTAPRAHRIGRFVKFRRDDVERWLAERADEPQPVG